jgi:hypothetical protein
MPLPPFVEALFAPLEGLAPRHEVTLEGRWSVTPRSQYASTSQLGSGAGPFVESTRHCYRGVLRSEVPLASMLLRCTASVAHWAKAVPAQLACATQWSLPPGELHATISMAGPSRSALLSVRATGADVNGLWFAEVKSPAQLMPEGPRPLVTLRPNILVEGGDAAERPADGGGGSPAACALVLLLFPVSVFRVGRAHLWRLREPFAATLPPALRLLLTRRRSGTLQALA